MATAQAITAEPQRIKTFRRELIKAIPRAPNDRASLLRMQQKQLAELLIDYLNWRSRYVGQRPRTVTIEPAAQADPRWPAHATSIDVFLDSVRRGDDLTLYLSLKPHTRGYSPAAGARRASPADRWSDKDFLLNVMGYHHFHLSTATRTNDVLFAKVDRDTFKVIAIFDHDVFEQNSAEQMRLWALHQTIVFRDVPPGSVVVMGNTTSSCHAIHVVRYASYCAVKIRDLEPKLDNLDYMRSLYPQDQQMPPKPEFAWGFRHLDLVIHERVAQIGFVQTEGWN